MIGMTIKYPTLLETPANEGERLLLASFGGVDSMLDAYRAAGVGSIEMSMLRVKKDHGDQAAHAAEKILGKGLQVTVHGLLEGLTGPEHFDAFAPLYDTILAAQGHVQLTVHPQPTREETACCLASFARTAWERYGDRLRIALENLRITVRDGSGNHKRITALEGSLPALPNVGICWDMGHYGYNQVMDGLPLDGVPPMAVLKRVIHTHIHSMKELDTHHPLQLQPATAYLTALRDAGYGGVYHLELMPDRYYMDVSPRQGVEDSIRTLKQILE